MKFKLTESNLMHWGDLDKNIKTDTRKIMTSRGTGHFGTGFYFVNADNYKDLHYDYNPNRPIYELDSSSYNLFKPKSNNQAYELHDAFKYINNHLDKDSINAENIINNIKTDLEELEDRCFDNNISDEEINNELANILRKYDPNKHFVSDFDLKYYIDNNYNDKIEAAIKYIIETLQSSKDFIDFGVKQLQEILPITQDKLKSLAIKYINEDSEDSFSTLVMKSLGYDGIDVSHLDKDADGVSGLDDFTYGTVIYDLKPGTFKRIKEPRIKS